MTKVSLVILFALSLIPFAVHARDHGEAARPEIIKTGPIEMILKGRSPYPLDDREDLSVPTKKQALNR